MTVFHSYQWDLNYTNPMVFVEMLDNIFFYAKSGYRSSAHRRTRLYLEAAGNYMPEFASGAYIAAINKTMCSGCNTRHGPPG